MQRVVPSAAQRSGGRAEADAKGGAAVGGQTQGGRKGVCAAAADTGRDLLFFL